MIGRNARLDNHGIVSREILVRVSTDEGIEGIGIIRRFPEEQLRQQAKEMVGQDPLVFFRPETGVTVKEFEFPLWDLLGKILGQPVWKLLGNGQSFREHIPAYDGSLYFCDLLYPEKGLKQVEEEVLDSLKRGFRAIKIKIGRGHRWMPPEEGCRRDIEVIELVRRVAGSDVSLMIDANNGYDRKGAERLMNEIGPCSIFFAEEMFPESVEEGLAFKAFLGEQALHLLHGREGLLHVVDDLAQGLGLALLLLALHLGAGVQAPQAVPSPDLQIEQPGAHLDGDRLPALGGQPDDQADHRRQQHDGRESVHVGRSK